LNGPLTGAYQASAFITNSDVSLHDPDHSVLASDTLLERGDSKPFEGADHSPLDSVETTFVDLFTESESTQDTANMVCECLEFAAHLTRNLGYVTCNFHIRFFYIG
jgi:hypothetical protein